MAPPIAYLILSHTHPGLVARLVDRLLGGDPEARVVVDHDRAGPALLDVLPNHPRLSLRSSDRHGGWGSYALASAARDGLSAVRRELDPEWTVLLSGQDYPTVPPAEVRRRLTASPTDAHLGLMCELTEAARKGPLRFWHARYFYRWVRLPRGPIELPADWRQRRVNIEYRFSRAQSRLFVWTLPRGSGTQLGVRRARTPFSPEYPCWGASQWFAVSRRGLDVLERELVARPELIALYRRSIIPDESMLQTVLRNSGEIRTTEPNLTFERHSDRDGAHADELEFSDLSEIVGSGRAFARKMHPSRSASLMDELDRRIGAAPWVSSREL